MRLDKQQSPRKRQADAKWAVIVDDQLVPMPRERVEARDILFQAGAAQEMDLLRDYSSVNDVGFELDGVVALAEGNVFRTDVRCATSREINCHAPPKLAFVVDDRWELTIQPHQTEDSLRTLVGVDEKWSCFATLNRLAMSRSRTASALRFRTDRFSSLGTQKA